MVSTRRSKALSGAEPNSCATATTTALDKTAVLPTNWDGSGVAMSVAIVLKLTVAMTALFCIAFPPAPLRTGIIDAIDAKLAVLWVRYVEPHSFEYVFAVGTSLLMIVCNTLPPIVFTIFDLGQFSVLESQRVHWHHDRSRKYPTAAECWMCAKQSLFLLVTTIIPMVCMGGLFFKWRGFTHMSPLPSLAEAFLFIPFFMLCEDLPGYVVHRLMHTPWLFKHVHGVHHRLTVPWALADLYMHPGEVLIMGLPRVIGPLILGGSRVHLFTHWTWLAYITINSYYDHSGYDFVFDPRRYLGIGGPRMHDSHHKFMRGCYGFNFKLLDQLMGTYMPQTPDELQTYKAQGGRNGLALQGLRGSDIGCKEADIGFWAVLRARFFD